MADQAGPSNAVMDAAQPAPSAAPAAVDRELHPSGIVPTLQNVVATVDLGCPLDLKTIAMHARNAEYNPKRFAAAIVRIKEPKTTALIFASGKMVCTGAKSEELAKLAAKKYTRILQKLGFKVTFKDFTVQNMVASCSVDFPIRLEGLQTLHSHFAHYEPECFPGLIYRFAKPNKVVLLIFVTGKVVLTGAKSTQQIYTAFESIYPVLTDFRKGGARQLRALPPAEPAPLALTAAAPPAAEGAAALSADAAARVLGRPSPARTDQDMDLEAEAPFVPVPTPAVRVPPPTPGSARIGVPPPTPGAARFGVPPPTPGAGRVGVPPPPSPMVPPLGMPPRSATLSGALGATPASFVPPVPPVPGFQPPSQGTAPYIPPPSPYLGQQ